MPKENSSPLPVTGGRVVTKHRWSFYWLLTRKKTRIDEWSPGYEAAAVAAYAETTRFAFIMIHVLPPPSTHNQIYSPDHTSSSFPSSSSTPARSPSPLQNAAEPAGNPDANLWGRNVIARRLFGLISMFCPLREQHVAPEVNSGTPLAALRVFTDITGKDKNLSSKHFKWLEMRKKVTVSHSNNGDVESSVIANSIGQDGRYLLPLTRRMCKSIHVVGFLCVS